MSTVHATTSTAADVPGAINIPLKKLGRETRRQLEPSRPVIVYCDDYQ